MAINAYTGLMGSGKTYEVVASVILPAIKADSPTLTKRSIETSTILSDGSAVIFGGLRSASENNASSGLFFLPKALRRNTQTGDETELFVLMSARRI